LYSAYYTTQLKLSNTQIMSSSVFNGMELSSVVLSSSWKTPFCFGVAESAKP